MSAEEHLAGRCESVAGLAREALAWVSDEGNTRASELGGRSLGPVLRRAARRAERLGRAARTKMSVSVFGPSQAGKSFLVSVLARPAGGRLVAAFPGPGGTLDYISEINPEGEGESTGLVTRFTMTRTPAPEGFPIRLVLMSEADIARTLINSFYRDGDGSEECPEPEAIAAHLESYRARMGGEAGGLGIEDVFEIADYVNGTFAKSAYALALRPFWAEAAEIAPRLGLAQRADFLAILWGGYPAFTGLYRQLAGALAQIGHAEEVHVALAALVPRETSIIDVKTLGALMDPSADSRLSLRTPDGRVQDLPRAAVCGLAAELVLPMQTQPWDVFATTDLLDFPGARNRFQRPLAELLRDPTATLSELLLRGKVAYLFDRYVENQEITSMLLCVPDSNMDTIDLPGLIETWIGLTHGATPEKRREAACILFFVLTKFDKHLGESAAGGGATTRFQRRMEASLEKFGRLGKSRDPWVDVWTEGRPFDNCFWLRNPNFFVEGLIEYDADKREVRVRPEKEDRLAELKAGCLAAPDVQRHFADPVAAWDAALALNDGGVSYLLGKLTAVCRPDAKRRQIGGQIEKLAADLALKLQDFHISDDIEARIEAKRQAAADVIDALEYALQSHRFGAVLARLLVTQDAIFDRILRVPSVTRISSAVSAAAPVRQAAAAGGLRAGPTRPLRPGRPEPAAAATPDPAEAPTEAVPARGRIATMTAEAFQAQTAVDVWIEEMRAFQDDRDLAETFGFAGATMSSLVGELIHGLRRTGVVDAMMADLRAISFGHTVDKQANPASIVCAERINGFVTRLGTDRLPLAERPKVTLPDGTTRPVFAGHAPSDSAADLPAVPRPVAEETWTDWVYALEALFVENASDSSAGKVDAARNLALGRILSGLRARGAA